MASLSLGLCFEGKNIRSVRTPCRSPHDYPGVSLPYTVSAQRITSPSQSWGCLESVLARNYPASSILWTEPSPQPLALRPAALSTC